MAISVVEPAEPLGDPSVVEPAEPLGEAVSRPGEVTTDR
jgi:hypothetical protein